MEFYTYTIEENPDKTVQTVTNIAMGCVIGTLVVYMIGLFAIATILFSIAVILGVVLAIGKKGNIQAYGVSKNKLVINDSSISIAGENYAMEKINDLRFKIASYAGLEYMRQGLKTYDGMDNYVSFNYNGKDVKCNFYLNSARHTLILGQLFDEFYRKKIPFTETDRYGNQTWIFRQLDEKELAAFKEKYGY
jgi:hypothetical protein